MGFLSELYSALLNIFFSGSAFQWCESSQFQVNTLPKEKMFILTTQLSTQLVQDNEISKHKGLTKMFAKLNGQFC